MSANYQYSRLLIKRSGLSGTTPTINTGSTDHTDGTWAATDIYEGEMFLNTADDLMWVRTSNGILPIVLSGASTTVTSAANLGSGSGLFYNNNAGVLEFLSLSAGTNVTIDNSMSGSGYILINSTATAATGNETAFSGIGNGNIVQINSTTPPYPINNSSERSLAINYAEISADGYCGGSYAFGNNGINYKVYIGNLTGETNTISNVFAFGSSYDNGKKGINASNVVALGNQYWVKSGATLGVILGGIDNVIGYNRFSSIIIGGSGNTINDDFNATTYPYLEARNVAIINGFRNVVNSGITGSTIIGGNALTATTSNTLYTQNIVVSGITANDGNLYATRLFSGNTDLSTFFTVSGEANTASNIGSGVGLFSAKTGVDLMFRSLSAGTYTQVQNQGNVTAIMLTGVPMTLSFAISDETTKITTGTNKITLYAPHAFTITDIQASLSQSGSSVTTFNVKNNGTTVFSTKATIDANEFHTSTAATPPVITGTSVSAYAKLTVDIDTAGTGAAGAKIYILGLRSL